MHRLICHPSSFYTMMFLILKSTISKMSWVELISPQMKWLGNNIYSLLCWKKTYWVSYKFQCDIVVWDFIKKTSSYWINFLVSNFITMTSWGAQWHLKSPASRLFVQLLIQGADERKHQSSASPAFVRGIHRWLVNSPHKGPVMRKMFPFDDVIM